MFIKNFSQKDFILRIKRLVCKMKEDMKSKNKKEDFGSKKEGVKND